MKKLIDCANWNEYEGPGGAVMFCKAGAYGKKLTVDEAKNFGCTRLKNEMCMKAMTAGVGFGLVPELAVEVPAEKTVSSWEISLGMAV